MQTYIYLHVDAKSLIDVNKIPVQTVESPQLFLNTTIQGETFR